MEIIIKETYKNMIDEAVLIVKNLIKQKPSAVLGLPTGNTPLGIYKKLVQKYGSGVLDFSGITTFNLDEYVEIAEEHPSSFRYYMNKNFFEKVNIKRENIHFPPSRLKNIEDNCIKYDKKIEDRGGLDLTILGIGRNGHIGFNEPTSSLSSKTRVKTLTEETLDDNDIRFEGDRLPDLSVTMGVGTIMKSKLIVLLASGKKKSKAIKHTIEGSISSFWPASILQQHPKAKIIIDNEASSLLNRKEYYKKVFKRKQYINKKINNLK